MVVPDDLANTARERPGLREGALIAIVDDDPSFRVALAALARSCGYGVICCGGADDLLAASELHRVDCVVTDVHMPVIGGIELMAGLRAAGSTAPVVMMTGRDDAGLDRRAREAGATALLRKPFDGDTFLRAVEEAMAASAGRR